MNKKISQPSKKMFKEVCDLIDSYKGIREAGRQLDFSATFLSNVRRGFTAITPDLAAKAGWLIRKEYMKK